MAGLSAIYVSGWQAAVDANDAGQVYPDLNLYPSDSVPKQSETSCTNIGRSPAQWPGKSFAATPFASSGTILRWP
jgi:hypothetical protein